MLFPDCHFLVDLFMYHLMLQEIAFLCELFIANITTIRFNLFMDHLMLQESAFLCEFFIANFTTVRFNLFMDQPMSQESVFLCEFLFANFTMIQFIISMNQFMVQEIVSQEIMYSCKLLATLVAGKGHGFHIFMNICLLNSWLNICLTSRSQFVFRKCRVSEM